MVSTYRLKSILHYNPQTGTWVWKKRTSNRIRVGDQAGTTTRRNYRQIKIDGRFYYSASLAYFYMTGLWIKNIDHKNLDPSDDRWNNLRPSTPSQNSANIRVLGHNKVGVKGVGRLPSGKYSSRLCGKRLGTFNTIEEASRAYAIAAKKKYGEFARWE